MEINRKFGLFCLDGGENYVLFCNTCEKVLMRSANNPSDDMVLRKVANGVVRGHMEAFTIFHLIDLVGKNSRSIEEVTGYLGKGNRRRVLNLF